MRHPWIGPVILLCMGGCGAPAYIAPDNPSGANKCSSATNCFDKALSMLEEARVYYDKGGAVAAVMPPGVVVAFAGDQIPDGWEICDGRSFDGSSPKYKPLSEAIGATHDIKGTSL